MKVFVSHASEQAGIAQSVDLALRGEGHQTFFDRASLPGGEAYNRAIREAVQSCDLFVFLVSPESPQKAADCLAHLGWADFLQMREGTGGLDPTQTYRRAFELDPDNVFAHAMLGHYLATTGAHLDQIRAQFRAALAAGRERDFVRHYQFAALLSYPDPQREEEAIRVADEMRRNRETLPDDDQHEGQRWRLWDVYYERLINAQDRADSCRRCRPPTTSRRSAG